MSRRQWFAALLPVVCNFNSLLLPSLWCSLSISGSGVGVAVPFRADLKSSVVESHTLTSYAFLLTSLLPKSFSYQAWEQLESVGMHIVLLLFYYFLCDRVLLCGLWLFRDSLCMICLLLYPSVGIKGVYHHSWANINFWKSNWPCPFSKMARAGSILAFWSGF